MIRLILSREICQNLDIHSFLYRKMINMNSHPKIIGTLFVFSMLLALGTGLAPSTVININALDFDVSDFECIAPVGNIGNNICSEDNSVTQETSNNVDNSTTNNNTNVTIIQSCNNNIANGSLDSSTNSSNTAIDSLTNKSCIIGFTPSDISPSTLNLS